MSNSSAPYELIYVPYAPSRGEHVRIILEEIGVPYSDTTWLGWDEGFARIQEVLKGQDGNPPYYAPPLFKHGDLIISQTSNILMYIGGRHGLSGAIPGDAFRVNALVCTALDGLSDEVHAIHHPIAKMLYYEDQKDASVIAAKEWFKMRLPKIFAYWQSVFDSKGGPWLLGESFTYADLVLSQVGYSPPSKVCLNCVELFLINSMQCIDGVKYAFPVVMDYVEKSGKYASLFKHWEMVRARPNIAKYLASDKRQKYANGIYRHYPELDVLPDELKVLLDKPGSG